MKATELRLGVEYCETGALAYGKEPDVLRPNKVRFLDLTPGCGWLRLFEAVEAGSSSKLRVPDRKMRWKEVDPPKLINPKTDPEWPGADKLPDRTSAYRIENYEPGDRVYVFQPSKGFYLGERWASGKGEWERGLIQAAAIHRTWSEWEVWREDRKAARIKRMRDQAPDKFQRELQSAMKQAKIAGYAEAYVLDMARGYFRNATGEVD